MTHILSILAILAIVSSISIPNDIVMKHKQLWLRRGTHSKTCYTQGFSFINETHILQSCGMYGRSYFHILKYEQNLPSLVQTYNSGMFNRRYFLQGSIWFQGKIYILTWREGIIFIYDVLNMSSVIEKTWHHGQGWGMTHNGTHLFISNGSNLIFITDRDINVLKTITVTNNHGNPVIYLNQLEWVNQNGRSTIYANIYGTSYIAKIDVELQKVIKSYDLTNLVVDSRNVNPAEDVLNGIAYDKQNNNFIITGKDWPTFYVVRLESFPSPVS